MAPKPGLLVPVTVGVGAVLVLQKWGGGERKVVVFLKKLQSSLGYAVRQPGPNNPCVLVPPLKWWVWNRVCLLWMHIFIVLGGFFFSHYGDLLFCSVFPPPPPPAVCSVNLITIMCLNCLQLSLKLFSCIWTCFSECWMIATGMTDLFIPQETEEIHLWANT